MSYGSNDGQTGGGDQGQVNDLLIRSSLAQSGQPPQNLPRLNQGAGGQDLRIQGNEGYFDLPGGFQTQQVPLQYIDPLFDPILIVFPQDNIRELNRRLRHYYKYDPHIRTAIDFHVEMPISDFSLHCPSCPEAEEYFNDFKNRVNLLDSILNICRDYWLLGEGFLYGNWDDTTSEFSGFVQLPPEEVEVHSAYVLPKRVYVLRPNKDLAKLSMSRNPADQKLDELMQLNSPLYAQALKQNKPFILDSNRLIVLQRSMAGYSNRGISPVMSVLKDLLFQDYLILHRMVFIQRHSYPLKIFKLGSAEKGFIPPPRWYDDFRRLLAQSKNDPDFNIVTHPLVNVEFVTGHDKILPLIPYFDLVKSRIFAGLFVSDAIISGEKTPFAAGITFMKGLMQRYLTFRNNLVNELNRKVFANLSRMHGFTMPTTADVNHKVKTRRENRLILPEIYWEKANLLSNQAIQQMIINLRDKKEIPMKYVADLFGWNYDDLLRQMKKEESTRFDPVWQELRKKAITDPKTKLSNLGRKVLLGDDVEEALKAQIKEDIKTGEGEEAAREKKEEEFKMPEVPKEAKARPEPEFGKRPSEVPPIAPPAPPGEGATPAEGKPKPAEAGAETAPPEAP